MGDYKYDIEYFLGGDWKFLAYVCGLGAANLVFGASVPGVKGLMQQEVVPHRQVSWCKIM